MAKEIIILDRLGEPSDLSFRYCFWAVVPSSRVSWYANANATSAFTGASAGELTAIQSGSVVEHVGVAFYPTGTAISAIQADLISKFNAFQAYITASNPTVHYGTYYDGSTWTLAGTT